MSARTTAQIPDHVAQILRDAEISGPNNTHLKIVQKLDPKTYKDCAKILEMLGGKWNRSAQATIFPKPISEVLADALDDGEVVNTKNVRQAFYTPAGIADLLVSKAEIAPGLNYLEPSVGGGALIDALQRAGVNRANITGIELDATEASAVQQRRGVIIHPGDFMTFTPPRERYDRIVMNPPFSNGQDAKHISHALTFLKDGGVLVAIVPPSCLDKDTGPYRELRKALDAIDWEFDLLPEGAFKESGTSIKTGILKITK
jgi:hypothetical protein